MLQQPPVSLYWPIFSAIISAAAFVWADTSSALSDAQRLFLGLVGVILAAVALVTGVVWILFAYNAWIESNELARFRPVLELSLAWRGLSDTQAQLIVEMRQPPEIDLIPDPQPKYFIRNTSIPLDYALEIINSAQERDGYLRPIRQEGRDRPLMDELISYLSLRGWLLETARGPYSARLDPERIPEILGYFGVEA